MAKRIAKMEVIEAGSKPDIDTDFRVDTREHAIRYVSDLYGRDNVSSIITFQKLAAKGAFKKMCTIYQIPFAKANKVSATIPGPIEGLECTLEELLTPGSDRYNEGADFRAATAGEEWQDVLAGALRISSRVNGIGVHACGVLMSSKPLHENIPMLVRQKDGEVVSQWEYAHCEAAGLIKYDFLGLNNIDIISNAVQFIKKNGKTPPNMVDLIHGPMDNKKTFELFQRGETIGVFQFGSDMMIDYCRFLKPDRFDQLADATALGRPGPMGMQSHVKYAKRKLGEEKITPIHADFIGSPLDAILAPTQNLVVYQEQILKIANEISGMTLKEGDALRSAMGKKKVKVMAAMRPKFMAGGAANGHSQEAMTILWDTIAEFAKYGFNKAHSVAYAMTSYQCAYLKANYPVEYMASLIGMNSEKKDKLRAALQDTARMGLKVGNTDINRSDVMVAPDYSGETGLDIVYGLAGISGMSVESASIIVKEREENGKYTSVQDVFNRCSPLGLNNRKVYESLALSGAFDEFGHTRRGIVEGIAAMMKESKTKAEKGTNLFDMFGGDSSATSEIELSDKEYAFVDKIRFEADTIGLYLSESPTSRMGAGLAQGGIQTIGQLKSVKSTTKATIVGALNEVTVITKRGKSIAVTIDDGKDNIEARLSREAVKGVSRTEAQNRIIDLYAAGESEVPKDLADLAFDESIKLLDPLVKNAVYVIDVIYRPNFSNPAEYNARVESIRPLSLADNGNLPIRIRKQVKNERELEAVRPALTKFAENLSKTFPGDYPIYAAGFIPANVETPLETASYYADLISTMEAGEGLLQSFSTVKKKSTSLAGFEGDEEVESSGKSKKNSVYREVPPFVSSQSRPATEEEIAERVVYFDTGFTAAKTSALEEFVSNKVGGERVDFGVFNRTMNGDISVR